MEPPATIVPGPVRVARFPNAANQPLEVREITTIKNSFLRAKPKNNFRFTAEPSGLGGKPGAREFQAMTTERHFRRGQSCDFRFGHQRTHECDWGSKAPLNFVLFNATDLPRGNTTAVEDLDCDDEGEYEADHVRDEQHAADEPPAALG